MILPPAPPLMLAGSTKRILTSYTLSAIGDVRELRSSTLPFPDKAARLLGMPPDELAHVLLENGFGQPMEEPDADVQLGSVPPKAAALLGLLSPDDLRAMMMKKKNEAQEEEAVGEVEEGGEGMPAVEVEPREFRPSDLPLAAWEEETGEESLAQMETPQHRPPASPRGLLLTAIALQDEKLKREKGGEEKREGNILMDLAALSSDLRGLAALLGIKALSPATAGCSEASEASASPASLPSSSFW
ncbi:unnamed protein product [Chrysoparadoxa australica]